MRGVPFAGEALGLGDLFRCHPLRELIALLSVEPPCEVFSRSDPGQLESHECQDVVLVDSGTVRKHVAETPLSWRVPLLSRPLIPRRGLGIVTEHATASEIQQAQVVLRWSMALLSRKSDPTRCLGVVL